MNNDYRDITDKLGKPLWWDEHAVPRYVEFSPSEVANIYAEEVAFVEIACQNCDTRFKVAFSRTKMDMVYNNDPRTLASMIEDSSIHYGDPPNYNCCPAGPTMNSVPLRVLEFWKRGLDEGDETENGIVPRELVWKVSDFRRIPELERDDITPDWAQRFKG